MKLLVSVVDEREAEAALKGGAELIDVKNPGEGALGAALPRMIRAVRHVTPTHVPVSAALGDFPFLPGSAALAAVGAAMAGADYVKVGLHGVRTSDEAQQMLRAIRDALDEFAPQTRLVACAYADAVMIGSLEPGQLPEVAAACGCAGALVDTYTKGHGSLFDFMTREHVAKFVAGCHKARLLAALAGCLTGKSLALAGSLGPDIVGVRTAVCTAGDRRNGRVEAGAVRAVLLQINSSVRGVV